MAGAPRRTSDKTSANAITADLVAVLVAVTDGEPKIMTIANAGALPSGPFEFAHRSLQTGLRAWVEAQTGHPLGYVEQLYTFADRGRTGDAKSPHSISISYLGLAREDQVGQGFEAHWSGWYDYFPWEDQRAGPPALLAKTLTPRAAGMVEIRIHRRPAARTLAARRHHVWPRRPRMERGAGAAAL